MIIMTCITVLFLLSMGALEQKVFKVKASAAWRGCSVCVKALSRYSELIES